MVVPGPGRISGRIPLKVFLLGLLWAGLSGIAPVAVAIQDDVAKNVPTDWSKVRRMSLVGAGVGVAGFYRKHRALLKLPPGFEEVL